VHVTRLFLTLKRCIVDQANLDLEEVTTTDMFMICINY